MINKPEQKADKQKEGSFEKLDESNNKLKLLGDIGLKTDQYAKNLTAMKVFLFLNIHILHFRQRELFQEGIGVNKRLSFYWRLWKCTEMIGIK